MMDSSAAQTLCKTPNLPSCICALNKKIGVPVEQKFSFSSENEKTYKAIRQENQNFSVSLSESKNCSCECKDNHQLFGRSFEKSHHNGDIIYDFGGAQEVNEDSGIEMLRAFSSNSSNSDRFTPVQSCGSSLVSYSSEPEVDRNSECGSESSEKSRMRSGRDPAGHCSNNCWKSRKIYERSRIGRKGKTCDGEVTSESCSETSSTHEAITSDPTNRSGDFKRSASNRLHGTKKCDKSFTPHRSESSTRNTFDKTSTKPHNGLRSSSTAGRISSSCKSLSSSRNAKCTAVGKCEGKPGKTRTEEGRRSSSQRVQVSGTARLPSAADPSRKSLNAASCIMSSSFGGGTLKACEIKSDALDKYGTLPRRAKKKSGDSMDVSTLMHAPYSRSHSVTREPSLNRAATLRRQQSKDKENSTNCKSLPPYPRPRRGTNKIIIYHEVSVQTVITGEDMNTVNGEITVTDRTSDCASQKEDKTIQTEGKEKLKEMESVCSKQREELQIARKQNEELRSEKENMMIRICKILGFPESKKDELKGNGLEELEKHFQAVGLTVMKQQEELSELRHYKRIANRDLEKSLAVQKNLLQQQQEIEEEYSELQEFLQAEKTALSESLVDTEEELKRLRDEVTKNRSLLEQQEEECKHLVRICEQRRQENLSLEAKLTGLDQRSRDVLVQQGAAVTAAAVALSGLGARLDILVEQLSASSNITEQELEDAVYHNEIYSKSEDSSPDDFQPQLLRSDASSQRESFLQVILGAIRNAASSSFVTSDKNLEPRKLSETFFYQETEPVMSFENCLEENSLCHFADCERGFPGIEHDKPEIKATECSDVTLSCGLARSNSLQNLSEAIRNRQMTEQNERSVALDEIISIEVNSLVDQIVDVDNLVTKLLKVIRIVQGNCCRQLNQLEKERGNFKDEVREEKARREEVERDLRKLEAELTELRSELNRRIGQLEEAKGLCADNRRAAVAEMQKRFALIDSALGALSSAEDLVERCPQLTRLRQDLKDCNYQRIQSSDVNANPENGHFENAKCNGAVLTTAV